VFGKYTTRLYVTGCDYAKRGNLQQYRHFMDVIARKLLSGQSVGHSTEEKAFWGEDAHITAIALLYDVCIYVYNPRLGTWHVFNDQGDRGYMMLQLNSEHTSVLFPQEPNRLPADENCQVFEELCRASFGWDVAADRMRNATYSFDYVTPWPHNHRRRSIQAPTDATDSQKQSGKCLHIRFHFLFALY
jgi:hypothetical protein